MTGVNGENRACWNYNKGVTQVTRQGGYPVYYPLQWLYVMPFRGMSVVCI